MREISRRQFMKKTMVMGVAIAGFPAVIASKSRARNIGKLVVHPNVDNLRVVSITDTAMTEAYKPVSSWKIQDKLVRTEVVDENIDKLACGLAETGNTTEAWRSIFIKPPRKSWSDTVVAIKTNNIAQQHTRSAVMSKICQTLTQTLGVSPFNIHIYDACHGGTMREKTAFKGLPSGCRVENTWGGKREINTDTSAVEKWQRKIKVS